MDKFSRKMKELERYLDVLYRNICHQEIMAEILATFPDLDMPTIIMDTGAKHPKTDTYMTYLKNKNIDEAIHKKIEEERCI